MTRQKLRLLETRVGDYRPDLILLQTYNTGPRFFFHGDDIAARIRADDTIWSELLLHVPRGADGRPSRFFRSSALVRLAVVVQNRIARSREPDVHLGSLTEIIEGEEAGRLRAALNGPLSGTPTVAFITPAGAPRRQIDESGVASFDLRDSEVPPGEEAVAVHPGASIHRWYGRAIADRLLAAGCIAQEGPCFGTLPVRPSPER
jgi:hypothetical protein